METIQKIDLNSDIIINIIKRIMLDDKKLISSFSSDTSIVNDSITVNTVQLPQSIFDLNNVTNNTIYE
jgi:hypothetical protein